MDDQHSNDMVEYEYNGEYMEMEEERFEREQR